MLSLILLFSPLDLMGGERCITFRPITGWDWITQETFIPDTEWRGRVVLREGETWWISGEVQQPTELKEINSNEYLFSWQFWQQGKSYQEVIHLYLDRAIYSDIIYWNEQPIRGVRGEVHIGCDEV